MISIENRAERLIEFFFSKNGKIGIDKLERNSSIDYLISYIDKTKEYHFGVILKGTNNIDNFKTTNYNPNSYKRINFTPLMIIIADINKDKLYYEWINAPSSTQSISSRLKILNDIELETIIACLTKASDIKYEVSNTDIIYFKNKSAPYQSLNIQLSFNKILIDNTILEIAYYFNGGSIMKMPLLLFKGDSNYILDYNQTVEKRLRNLGVRGELFVERMVFTTAHQPFRLKIESNYPLEVKKTLY